jgi:hypothetical protein
VGVVDGVPYAFVTLERIGGLMVWDLSNPEDARYVRYLPPTSQDYGPEVVTFVSAADSPNGRALVLSANEVSGSVTVYEVSSLTPISAIQGSGTASPLVGQTVTVEAIVVGDFQNNDADQTRNLGGFWLQEEAFDSDGNPLTSEGIFVAQNALPADVQLGDRVRVTGTVAEVFNNTEINATAITVVQAGAVADVNTLAVAVDLPAAGVQGSNGNYRADLERYEGMLVKFPETLTVTEQFNLDQFGEIVVTEGHAPPPSPRPTHRAWPASMPICATSPPVQWCSTTGAAPPTRRWRHGGGRRLHHRQRAPHGRHGKRPDRRAGLRLQRVPRALDRERPRRQRLHQRQSAPGRARRCRRHPEGRQLQRAELLHHAGRTAGAPTTASSRAAPRRPPSSPARPRSWSTCCWR